jgi:signal transduction histidine kinase
MRRYIITVLLLLTGGPLMAGAKKPGDTALSKLSLQQLKHRETQINTELSQLARTSLRSGIGSIGYRSMRHEIAEKTEWVEIELEGETQLDEIVLVPVLRRDSEEFFLADGFPEIIRIFTGSDSNHIGTLLSETYSEKETQGIAPVVIPANGVSASWVRIEASQLDQEANGNQYLLQLAEVMIFSNQKNLALRRPVKTSSVYPTSVSAWDKHLLVDGQTPYVMNAAQGKGSDGYLGPRSLLPSLTLDLGETFPLSGIRLHALHRVNTVPQANSARLGIPNQLLIEGASTPDFQDAITLLDFRRTSDVDTGPIMMWNILETPCRYVRLTATKPAKSPTRIGFSEIELFAQGQNVALGKPVCNNLRPNKMIQTTLTDGLNLYGRILPTRTWLNQLARRHSLELELPQIEAELALRYAEQNATLRWMTRLAALLAAGIGFTILIDWNLRMRHATQIRERFAADLHDELGANIHTIGLLGDLAREAESRAELLELLDRSRVFTERSGDAVRYCTNMLEARGLCEDLVEDMKRSSERLLADLDHDLSFENTEHLKNLPPRKRIDLFFFYKECLNNIIRHSGATQVVTRLKTTPNELTLTITDNGLGLGDNVPSSLKRRARLLRAKLDVETPPSGGTKITLRLRHRRRRHGAKSESKNTEQTPNIPFETNRGRP